MTFYQKTNLHRTFFSILILTCLLVLPLQAASAQTAVVHAVLFFSPSCPHCHDVMTNVLPPLQQKYGEQLVIVNINTTEAAGGQLYQAAVDKYKITEDRRGVPTLIVGDTVLVGSREIPGLFPSIIEKGIAAGGIAFPDLPDLDAVINNQPVAAQPTFLDQMNRDIVGNGLAVLVLFGLLYSLIHNGSLFYQKTVRKQDYKKTVAQNAAVSTNWWFLALLVVGVIVASYLTYVEMTQNDAICGPVGDCNAVQQSPYAKLFGILPIGLFGLFGYVLLAGAWVVQSFGSGKARSYAVLAAFLFSLFGVLFSIYLTFLEPFVIGATCAWCLTSAIVMGIMLWITVKPAVAAWYQLKTPIKHAAQPHHA